VIYLTLAELLHVARRTLGPDYAVRDYGLLEAALARPQATAFGKDAWRSLPLIRTLIGAAEAGTWATRDPRSLSASMGIASASTGA
jgi:hypothetical protein